LTVPAYPGNWGISDTTMREEIAPIVRDVARETGATVIDLYGALRSKPQLFPDKVHPNDEGAQLIAAEVYRALTGQMAPGMADVNDQMPAFRARESVLFQGDSITDGNRGRNADPNHILGHGYAFLVAAQNGAKFAQRQMAFANRGVSGNKVSDLAARWTNDTIDLKPTLLSILIGVNDASARVPLAQFEANYDKLLADTIAALPGVRLVLCEPFSLPVGAKKDNWDIWFADIKARQAVVERLGTKYRAPVVHFQAAFDEAAKRAPASYWIWDGVHPTYAGHQLMADEWTRTVNQFWPAESVLNTKAE
jgi:lysophospholipase L1-like esterase